MEIENDVDVTETASAPEVDLDTADGAPSDDPLAADARDEDEATATPRERLDGIVESLLFAGGAPLPLRRIVDVLDGPSAKDIKAALGRLMAQVAAELGEEKHPNLAVALAEGVRRVVKAERVRICSTPIDVVDGQESIAVAIPTSDGSPATLQATFQPGWEPTGLDLKLLTAAAGLAAVVIEFGSDSL